MVALRALGQRDVERAATRLDRGAGGHERILGAPHVDRAVHDVGARADRAAREGEREAAREKISFSKRREECGPHRHGRRREAARESAGALQRVGECAARQPASMGDDDERAQEEQRADPWTAESGCGERSVLRPAAPADDRRFAASRDVKECWPATGDPLLRAAKGIATCRIDWPTAGEWRIGRGRERARRESGDPRGGLSDAARDLACALRRDALAPPLRSQDAGPCGATPWP